MTYLRMYIQYLYIYIYMCVFILFSLYIDICLETRAVFSLFIIYNNTGLFVVALCGEARPIEAHVLVVGGSSDKLR